MGSASSYQLADGRAGSGSVSTLQTYRLTRRLFKAIVRDDFGAAEKALTDGADPNGVDKVHKRTPMTLAALHARPEIVTLLRRHGGDPNQECPLGTLPLTEALSSSGGCPDEETIAETLAALLEPPGGASIEFAMLTHGLVIEHLDDALAQRRPAPKPQPTRPRRAPGPG